MNKRKLIFTLFLLLPLVGWAQYYYGQHVSMKRTTGDSIQYDISKSGQFRPVVRDGKVVWSFQNWVQKEGTDEIELKEKFALDNVESIDFRSKEYDETEVRKALIEFYNAMDGPNWTHQENWCSDKPIWEWYGVNGCDENNIGENYPWVDRLWLASNNLSGKLPENMDRMGPAGSFGFPSNNIEGGLPESISNIYSLSTLYCFNNQLTGSIPAGIAKLPHFTTFSMDRNLFNGPLSEEFILACMDNKDMPANNFSLFDNNYSGKVSMSIQQHPRFVDFWPGIVIQNQPIDVSDLVIPAPVFTTKDINGNTIDLAETYKKNKYTLLYKWAFWCPFSEAYNQTLVPTYKGYKDKGLEVIGIHCDLNYDDGLADYLKDHDIPWNNTIAKDWGYDTYGNKNSDNRAIFEWGGTPQVFLVDENGNIVFNSLMDDKGNKKIGTFYRDELFTFLEEHLGKIDYNFYTSTDYSRDGEVTTLQTATTGKGIDLMFVGEGFTDKNIEEGSYDQRMNEAVEQFFAYEPYASLRNRFNIYAVKAVSPNAEFADGCTQAINEDYSKALEYASKVPNLKEGNPLYVNVVYSSPSGGRSFCVMMEDNSYVCFAMEGANKVLNHEAGGHGIGKLFDEYVEGGNESATLPEEQKAELDNAWTDQGWGANVDWHSDPTEVKWAKFISDSRYADEKIGLYEGSYLYQYGAYRPTENSMMRYNDSPFNAPSREAIYKRVMQESEGDGWTYDYETFVAFDAPGHQQFVDYLNRQNAAPRRIGRKDAERKQILTAPPVFLKGTWRDVLEGKKK